MTALRPERETDASYGDQSYEASGALGDWHVAGSAPGEPYRAALDDETMALRLPDPAHGPENGALRASGASSAPGPPAGGRAARRKAAKRRGGRHGGASREAAAPAEPDSGRPLSRVEARRQARLRKPGPGVIASRAIGE
ncbi:class E sortase, partial [Streptomyces sp. SAS_269]